jgi:hypothetical protein
LQYRQAYGDHYLRALAALDGQLTVAQRALGEFDQRVGVALRRIS